MVLALAVLGVFGMEAAGSRSSLPEGYGF